MTLYQYQHVMSQIKTLISSSSTATAGTKTVTTMEQKSVQLAYTTGGATIGITQADVSNADYTAGKEEEQTVISLEFLSNLRNFRIFKKAG